MWKLEAGSPSWILNTSKIFSPHLHAQALRHFAQLPPVIFAENPFLSVLQGGDARYSRISDMKRNLNLNLNPRTPPASNSRSVWETHGMKSHSQPAKGFMTNNIFLT